MLNVEDLSARLGALNGDSAILGSDALSAISELSGKMAARLKMAVNGEWDEFKGCFNGIQTASAFTAEVSSTSC